MSNPSCRIAARKTRWLCCSMLIAGWGRFTSTMPSLAINVRASCARSKLSHAVRRISRASLSSSYSETTRRQNFRISADK